MIFYYVLQPKTAEIYDILLYIMDKHTYKHLFKQFTIQTSKNIIGHE